MKLIIDEKIAFKSTAAECTSDVPRELVDVKMTHVGKAPDRPDLDTQRDSAIGMERLRSYYTDHCIPEFTKREGFGSRSRDDLLKVAAMRITPQYVLGTTDSDVRTDDPALLSADDQRFLTFLKEVWWPLFQVLAKGPYTTIGLTQCTTSEFYSQHIVQLHTQ